MKFGLCANMDARDSWGVGYERIATLKKLGYDYVELPLAQVVAMDEDVFEREVLGAIKEYALPCHALNNFFPASVRLTGSEADPAAIEAYAQMAIGRAARMGALVIVLGSSGARNLLQDTGLSQGMRQLADALGIIAPIARARGIQIALEPLNRLESNILNSYQSGLYLAALSGQSNVKTLVDAYHFGIGNEPLSDLLICPPIHVHFAQVFGRKLPERADETQILFFKALRDAGYDGCVSLEGYAGPDFETSAKYALETVNRFSDTP